MTYVKMRTALGVCLGGIIVGSPPAAWGQTSSDFTNPSRLEARASIVIPFVGSQKSKQTKPQFALGLRHERARTDQYDWALRAPSEAFERRDFKLSVTLEDRPVFLLNNQTIMSDGQLYRKEEILGALDTYDKTVLTVIGVSLAVIAGSIIILAE